MKRRLDDLASPVLAEMDERGRSHLTRRVAWVLFNAYGITVTGSGFLLLALSTLMTRPSPDMPLMVGLVLLSFLSRRLGFPIARGTNSLSGIVDLTSLLLFGPVVAAWQATISSLLDSAAEIISRPTRNLWLVMKAPLFNAGLKTLMALCSAWVYLGLGGRLRPAAFTGDLVLPGVALVTTWFLIDYGAWAIIELLTGGRARLAQWLRYVFASSVFVELLPLPLAFLGAASAVVFGTGGLLLCGFAVLMASLAIRLLAEARARAEARVTELSTLNRTTYEIIEASRDEQNLCDLIYRNVTRVVDASTFILCLIDEPRQEETVRVLVADGQRLQPVTIALGGVATWMLEHRKPLLISDVRKEALPFTPRPLSAGASDTRSLLYVPMLAGQNLVGFMSIQSPLPHRFTPDDTRILAAMANQAAMAIANVRLQRQAAIRQSLEQELRLASDIQRSLLPSAFPILPGFEIAAHWESAREVSGDFYDFLSLSDGRLGIVIADVSDKGVPAALFMALSRSLVRSGLLGSSSAAEGLAKANRWILKDSGSDMFLTLFYGALDANRRT